MAELALSGTPGRQSWPRRLLAPAAFLASFGLFVYLTFPFNTVAHRLELEARKSGLELSIQQLGPAGALGVRARGVSIKQAGDLPGTAPLEAKLDRIDVKPELFPLLLRRISAGFLVEAWGGEAHGTARISSDPKVPGLSALQLEASDFDLKQLPPSLVQEMELVGRLGAKADLTSLNQLEAASGAASLSLKGAAVVKGTLKIEGMGAFPLPKTVLGDVTGQITIEKGNAKVERLTVKGGDIEADVDGAIRLKPLLSLSQAELHVKLKPSEKWLDANPLIKSSMGFLGPKSADGYVITLTGPLARLTPGRGAEGGVAEGAPPGSLSALASAIAPQADTPVSPGPLNVATLNLELADPERGRALPLRAHLPSEGGPFPVIVFSHGLGGSRLGYGYLGKSWASHGYAVLHPTHAGSDASLLRGRGLEPFRRLRAAMHDPANWEARARDVRLLLDRLPSLGAEGPLAGRIDAGRAGVGGHSFGAWTAGVLAGALVRFPGEAEPRTLADPRPRAFACLSPPGYGDRGLEPGAWSPIERPLLEITGTEDRGSFNGEPVEWRLAPFRDLRPGGKWLLILGGADHLSFAGGTMQTPAREAQKAIVEEATLAFWDAHLKGDERSLSLLQPASLERDGIAVQVEHR